MLVRKQYKYKINHNNSDTHLVPELLAFSYIMVPAGDSMIVYLS